MNIEVISIQQLIPCQGWVAIYDQDEPPYFMASDVDFWVACKYIDLSGLPHQIFHNLLLDGIPLDSEENAVVRAHTSCGVFAATAGENGFGLGDLDICAEADNFLEVVKRTSFDDDAFRDALSTECRERVQLRAAKNKKTTTK